MRSYAPEADISFLTQSAHRQRSSYGDANRPVIVSIAVNDAANPSDLITPEQSATSTDGMPRRESPAKQESALEAPEPISP